MLDPRRLRVFRAVVAAGSMRRAAADLGYTPSAVSQHIAALQKETGLRLVEPDGRGVRPTPAGRALAEAAAGVLADLAELDATVERLRHGKVGALTVQYFASVGAAWMPEIFAELTREFPDLRLELRLAEQDDGSSGPTDLGIVLIEDDDGRSLDRDVHPLLEEPFLVVVPDTHRLASLEQIPLAELASEPWIDNDPSDGACRRLVVDACAAAGFAPRFTVEAHDYSTAIAFVSAGLGVTVVPRLALDVTPRPGLRVVSFADPAPTRRLGVRIRRSLGENLAAQRLLSLLRDQAERSTMTAAAREGPAPAARRRNAASPRT